MTIRPAAADAPATPAAHGMLSAVVSVILGVAAHGFGGGYGGHGPATSHLMILAAMAGVVGVIRAGQVRTADRRRARGQASRGWFGTGAALIGGQVAAHLALSLLGHGAGLLPDARMTAWHVVALPVAVVVLVVAERLEWACARQIGVIVSLAAGTDRLLAVLVVPVHSAAAAASTHLAGCSGIRGPPARV